MTVPFAYLFGDVRVDRSRMVVSRAGRQVDLEPKTFDVLLYLLDNRDRLVTKEELIDTVWAGTFVTPNALTRAIAQLRKTIGDDAQEPKYVETAARRGYRFIAPVTVGEEAPAPIPAAVAPRRRSRTAWIAAVAALALIAAGLAGWRMWPERPEPPAAVEALPKLERVTTRLGYNGMPSISPDGTRIAYVSDRTGGLEIYVTSFTPGGREVAITSDGRQNVEPAWSPDGQWIAYHSRKTSGIWIVEATGGVPRQVTDFGSMPGWSPDGSTLAFNSDVGGLSAQSTLWTVRRDGTGLRQLTRPGHPQGGHRDPSWSYSGKWIAFNVIRGLHDWTVGLVSTQTGAVKMVSGAVNATSPRFIADDTAILFLAWQGQAGVFRRRIDPRTGEGAGPIEMVAPLENSADRLSIARDGTLVVGVTASDANLWSIDLGPDGTPSEPRRITNDSVRNGFPSYDSNGRLVFIRMGIGGRRFTTWLMNGDGTQLEPLLIDRDNGSPQWYPGGGKVLVRWDPSPGDKRFSWIDVATRRVSPGPFPANDIENARISPDGRDIAYHARGRNGVLNVYTRSLAGGPPKQITLDAEAASYPAWSSDGRQIAVEVKRGDTTQIAVVSREGGPLRVLTRGRGQHWPHTWSPDGRWIAYAGQKDGIWNLWLVSPGTGETRQLTKFSSVDGYVRYPAFSPDAKRIVFERSTVSANVWARRATMP